MAAGSTYTPIATTTASGSTTSVTFSSIAGTYTDIVVVCNVQNAASGDNGLRMQFNSDTGNNYSTTYIYGDGTSAVSGRQTSASGAQFGRSASGNITTSIGQVQNYSNSTTYKTVLGRGNNPAALVWAAVSLWRSTSAITSITIYNETSATISAGSTFTLYGIASA
jgi:hypothetical protein